MKKLFLLALFIFTLQPLKPAEFTLRKTTSDDYGRAGKWIGLLVGGLVWLRTFNSWWDETGMHFSSQQPITKNERENIDKIYSAIMGYSFIKGLFSGTISCYLYKTILHDFFSSRKIILSETEVEQVRELLKEETKNGN